MSVMIEQQDAIHYTVTFNGTDDIETTVTSFGNDAAEWVAEIYRIHQRRLSRLIVGFDVEWRPSFSQVQNPVAVLQICVGRRCLVFLVLHADHIPDDLLDFLADNRFTFVGVGIGNDADRLYNDHSIFVPNTTDLRGLAAENMGRPGMNQKGLAGLAKDVLGVEVRKPRRVTMSHWDNMPLTHEQIMYAAVDAFLSFEIGRRLFAGDF
ncbi:Werner Syndrome-like exonuclease [Phoenix dactylifera]|uniref:Werner Syndrome-like exonuclease n=1 Tax=Phoenix dactylifera TaxID=42345 RepID=A0A8B7BHJ2_PHODC|nr:Werner Syndrome-like exonuclease [Phoenix dactylifera]